MTDASRLTAMQLNRTLLERQLLVDRRPGDVEAVVTHLCGMNAQYPDSPYFGVSARVAGFSLVDMENLTASGALVRSTLMRGTLHLVTEDDLGWMRPALQPALERTLRGFFPSDARRIDPADVAGRTRQILAAAPATRQQLVQALAPALPDSRGDFLAHAARTVTMLVHEPAAASFRGVPSPAYLWRGHLPGHSAETTSTWRRNLVTRYLAAFGPASVKDIQYWCGMSGLNRAVTDLGERLTRYTGPSGETLWDLADATITANADVPAITLLPDYDNILFAHADRGRIVTDEVRRKVVAVAKRMQRIVLRNGFVAGTWALDPGPYADRCLLRVRLSGALSTSERACLERETARIAALLHGRGTRVDGPTVHPL